MTPLCKHYHCGNCIAHSGYIGKEHILMGCSNRTPDGIPKPFLQKRHCKEYESKEK